MNDLSVYVDDYWDLKENDKVKVRYLVRYVVKRPERIKEGNPSVAVERFTYFDGGCDSDLTLMKLDEFDDLELIGRADIFIGDRFRCTNTLVMGFGAEYKITGFSNKMIDSHRPDMTLIEGDYLRPEYLDNEDNWVETSSIFLNHLRESCKRYNDDGKLADQRIVEWGSNYDNLWVKRTANYLEEEPEKEKCEEQTK